MPQLPDLKSDDATLAKVSREFVCAIKFSKNRKRNFDAVIKLCRGASIFAEQDDLYFVAFEKSKEGFKLANLVFEEMRVASWRYSAFANERVIKRSADLHNLFDCYCTAIKCRKTEAHCHVVEDHAFEVSGAKLFLNFDEDEPQGDQVLIPCSRIAPFLELGRKPSDALDVLDAVAVQRLTNLCPLFDASKFQIIKSLETKKRYW